MSAGAHTDAVGTAAASPGANVDAVAGAGTDSAGREPLTVAQRRALESLRFNWAHTPEDVWHTPPYHVDGLHTEVMDRIRAGIRQARESEHASPIGLAVQGQRGTGKTHLLGLVRQRVQAQGGYFFLVDLLDGATFWRSVAAAMVHDLHRETSPGLSQLAAFLDRLSTRAAVLSEVRKAVLGATENAPSRRELSSFIGALRRLDRRVGLECQDTARALVLCQSQDPAVQDIGYAYLQSYEETEPGQRARWGIQQAHRLPQQVVSDLSRLLALTGPSVIAVDQIDAVVAEASHPVGPDEPLLEGGQARQLEQVAGGLMGLRDHTRRTLTVVASLPDSWVLIKQHAVNTVRDRFREASQLYRIPDAEVGRELVERRLAVKYRAVDFIPPYPTWPVHPAAFADAHQLTPRQLLQCIDKHVDRCLRDGTASVLHRLVWSDEPPAPAPEPVAGVTEQPDTWAALDARFARLRREADPAGVLTPEQEDTELPELLAAGLSAWIFERGNLAEEYSRDPVPGPKPALHARLRRTLDERTEEERHWAFRSVTSTHHIAVQSRIRHACEMSGLRQGGPRRRLFLLRQTAWPTGRVTRALLAEFHQAGGVSLPMTDADLRTFAALRQLLQERDPDLPGWLLARQPATGTELFSQALADALPEPTLGNLPPATTPAGPLPTETASPEPMPAEAASPEVTEEPEQPVPADGTGVGDADAVIPVGVRAADGRTVQVGLASLRRHTAIFAGSGSGKTVLIRRLIEECALRGVSTIVVDPQNDLARLGDPWPQPPAGWGPGDAERAARYLAGTEVVVWTPRRQAGRPLTFQPLPDFASVRHDQDELAVAIDAAVTTLAPRAKVDGQTAKADRGKAVLRQAMEHFAAGGNGHLKRFIDLLSDLPDGVSDLDQAGEIAADLAQNLTAATVNDPLFGGDGTPVDPGVLLTPTPGKRARVSVISMVGLPDQAQRQSFVNQLQMGLFAWIKRNPATDRPLGGLLVLDEAQDFAPSGAMTPCTRSTLALASQARKYGLGLVFATQAPKGLHNRIPGNAATQFFGLLNAPVQIQAAREMARIKGGSVDDIGTLGVGQFYLASDEEKFTRIRTPLCLSHHPASPLTPEEVVTRARAAG